MAGLEASTKSEAGPLVESPAPETGVGDIRGMGGFVGDVGEG